MKVFGMQILLLAALMFWGCESTLSDVELTDPSVLQFQAVITHTEDSGEVSESISVHLRDRKEATVELKNGSVEVNGLELVFQSALFGYLLPQSQVEVTPDSLYLFDVILADGEHYPAQVTTQPGFIEITEIPDTLVLGEDLHLAWSGAGQEDPVIISLWIWAGEELNIQEFQVGDLQQTQYTISAAYFQNPPQADLVKVEVKSRRLVPGNDQFSSAEIESDFSTIRRVTLVPGD